MCERESERERVCERVRERENEREGGRVGQFVGGREGGRERVCGFVCEGEREREHRHSQVVLYNDVPTLSRCLCMHTTYACIHIAHIRTHTRSFVLSLAGDIQQRNNRCIHDASQEHSI